jgi:DNA-binding NarL/FixJ family response regulator
MSRNEKEEKIKLFIADDHTIVRKGFVRLFELDEKMEVVGEAEDGKMAVEQVKSLSPDIVLMDIAMPVLNGLEATQRIKKATPDVKVLILSAYDNDQYIYRVIRAGAHGYLMKNIDANELYSAVKAVHRGEYVFPESVRSVFKDELARLRKGIFDGVPDSFHSLTDREREILQLIAEGKNHQYIADFLHISVRTVDTHRNNIIKKLDVHDTANLVLYAIKNGITILPG